NTVMSLWGLWELRLRRRQVEHPPALSTLHLLARTVAIDQRRARAVLADADPQRGAIPSPDRRHALVARFVEGNLIDLPVRHQRRRVLRPGRPVLRLPHQWHEVNSDIPGKLADGGL